MTVTGPPAAPLRGAVLIGWGLACCVLIAVGAKEILAGYFPDPDDTMRLLEVRALLDGQGWWDVSQHRLASGLMHWSRLIDLPLAAVIALVRPLAGQAVAERVAMVVVPLVTLLVVMAAVAQATRRLLDIDHARIALLIAPMSIALLSQVRPMRIDHHGWQVALALLALLALISPARGWRSGAYGGLALAALLTVSLEGLPVAVALLALFGMRWIADPRTGPAFLGAIWTAALAAAILHIAMRGPAFLTPACDAMAPVWLAMLAVAAIGASLAVAIGGRSLVVRAIAAGAAGAASIGVLFAIDPRCAAGPFGMLEPLVRTMWYNRITEGLPIWDQAPGWATMCVALPCVGLIGSIVALRGTAPGRREAWWLVIGASVAAFALSLLVNRAAATANAFAVPGASVVVLALLTRARRVRTPILRIVATTGALVVAGPGSASVVLLGMPRDDLVAEARDLAARTHRKACEDIPDIRAVAALPPARLFAPIDVSPEILATTGHSAIASGHHRNAVAIADVMRAFIATPETARRTIARYRADYVVGCPGIAETAMYDQVAPDGFWARLERGERFAWLRPVSIPGSPVLVWRVIDPSHRAKPPLS